MNNYKEDSGNVAQEIAEKIIERHIQYIEPLNHDRYKSYFTHFLATDISLVAGIFYLYDKKLNTLIKIGGYVGIIFSIIWFMIMLKITLDIRVSYRYKEMVYKNLGYPEPPRLKWHGIVRFIRRWFPPSWLMLSFPLGFIAIYIFLSIYLNLS